MLPFPDIDPVLVKLGPLKIRWYGLAYIGGLLLAFQLIKNELRTKLNMTSDNIVSLMTYSAVGIVLGGRLGYVLFYNLPYYLQHPKGILAVWHGGMSFHGGAIGCVLAIYLFTKKHNIDFLKILDLLGLSAPIGLGLGRLANFINGELYGRVTTVPWAIIFPRGGELPRHPSQLYEAFFEGIILFIILYIISKKNFAKNIFGFNTSLFLILYGIFRFFLEFIREPDSHLGLYYNIFTMGQFLSIPMIFVGIIIIRKIKNV